MGLFVFLPEQGQRHALFPHLPVDILKVRLMSFSRPFF